MFIVIGIVVVFGSIVAGYLMEHGNLRVLVQPAELIIIGGAAIGTLLIANPLQVIKKIAGGVIGSLKGSHFNQGVLSGNAEDVLRGAEQGRKDGLLAIESDIEEPDKSASVFQVPEVSQGPSHAGLCLRHAAHGGDRRHRPVRPGPDDGPRHGGVAPRRERADCRTQHGGRLASRAGHCGRGAGRGDHHGRAGRPSGRDWAQRWPRRWWERFWEFCSATDSWGRWRRTWRSWRRKNTPTCTWCGWC